MIFLPATQSPLPSCGAVALLHQPTPPQLTLLPIIPIRVIRTIRGHSNAPGSPLHPSGIPWCSTPQTSPRESELTRRRAGGAVGRLTSTGPSTGPNAENACPPSASGLFEQTLYAFGQQAFHLGFAPRNTHRISALRKRLGGGNVPRSSIAVGAAS